MFKVIGTPVRASDHFIGEERIWVFLNLGDVTLMELKRLVGQFLRVWEDDG